jgi:hypothetical protein
LVSRPQALLLEFLPFLPRYTFFFYPLFPPGLLYTTLYALLYNGKFSVGGTAGASLPAALRPPPSGEKPPAICRATLEHEGALAAHGADKGYCMRMGMNALALGTEGSKGWRGFCAALTAAQAKTMPKGFYGMKVVRWEKM